MVTVPLGVAPYKRAFAGAPEVQLVNRFVEKSPTNQKEHIALIARPGTNSLVQAGPGAIRSLYAKQGLFNSDLFIVSGNNLWRYTTAGVLSQITGVIAGTGFTYASWMKGIGYEFLFISDGATLQYFTTHAVGTLTLATGSDISNQVIRINGSYYTWGADVDANSPAGTAANPWIVSLDSGGDDFQSLANMALAINGGGVSGVDYSTNLVAPNADVSAVALGSATKLVLTALVDGTTGNAVTTAVVSGAGVSFAAATLTGGGGTILQSVAMPNANEQPKALAELSSYVLVSVANSQKFYWLNPGETVIDPLNFASKESNPDPIIDMKRVGDNVLITGQGSTETWYATGNLDAPFAPIQGRTWHRGVVDGTTVVVGDAVILVGVDGIVYKIEGGNADPISTPAIAERIRTQLRRTQGITP